MQYVERLLLFQSQFNQKHVNENTVTLLYKRDAGLHVTHCVSPGSAVS